jgi:iron(III) transport system permease protein
MRPALIYACLLTFIGSLEMLSVPLVFGRPVGIDFFTTFLYDAALGTNPDYGLVGAAATLLLVIIIGLLLVQGMLLRNAGRFVTMKGKAQRPKLARLGRVRWAVFAVIMLYNVLILVLPLIGITVRAFTTFLTPLMSPFELLTLDNFRLLFEYPEYVRSIANSTLIALFGGAAATLFVALIAIVAHRSPFRFARQLEFVAMAPRAIPGIVASMGLFWAMQLLPFVHLLYGTIGILMIAFTMRAIPTAYGAIAPALFQIAKELDQGARACGADWWTTSIRVVLPLLKPALFSAYVLLFLSFMKEYSSAVFLFAPGSEVIGTTMLSFWGNGDTGPVSALSVVQLGITVIFVLFARIMLRTHRDG